MLKKVNLNTQLVVGLSTVLLWILLMAATWIFKGIPPFARGNFMEAGNIQNLMVQMAITGVLAVGAVMVILTGGIDLSVGQMISFSGIFFGLLLSTSRTSIIDGKVVKLAPLVENVPMAIILVLIVSLLIGLINGILVYDFKLPSFIATLGMMIILRGAANRLAGGSDIGGIPERVGDFADSDCSFIQFGDAFSVPNLFLFLIVTVILFEVIQRKTTFGRYVYALGSNAEAARLSGVNTRIVTYGAYMLCSLLGGLAGCMMVARMNMASITSGEGYELEAIAAAVLGGASLMGAEGNAIGAFIGALLMTTILNGATLAGIDSTTTKMIVGAILLTTVAVDQFRKRRSGD